MQTQEEITLCPLCASYRMLPPQSAEDEVRYLKHLMGHGLTV